MGPPANYLYWNKEANEDSFGNLKREKFSLGLIRAPTSYTNHRMKVKKNLVLLLLAKLENNFINTLHKTAI